jgi:hypothetical protein
MWVWELRLIMRDGPACLLDGVNVCRPARLRQSDADHAVARDNLGEFFFGPILGPGRAQRKHDEPALLVGVLNSDLYLGRQDQTKLCEDLTRPPD